MTVLYTFIDESGNFDFSPSGTRYFVLTGFSTFDPHSLATGFYRLRHDLLSQGHEVEYFHATEDRQAVRDAVFRELSQHMFEIDAVIIEKAKTHPGLRPIERFYPRISSILLNYILQRHLWRGIDEFVIYTASVATKGKREAFTKGIKRGIVSTAGKGRRTTSSIITPCLMCIYRLRTIVGGLSTGNGKLAIVDLMNWCSLGLRASSTFSMRARPALIKTHKR